MKLSKFILVALFLPPFGRVGVGLAQQLPLSNQYTINKFSLSPAYAGTGEAFEVFGSYRNEWMNIAGAPESKMVSANGIICKNMGLGGTLSSQQAGIFQDLSASASYAYHVKLADKNFLSFGVGLGLLESRVNIAGSTAQSDPIAANNADVNALVMDAGFGILYRFKALHTAITIPRMISSQIKDVNGNTVYTLAMQQGFNIGYKYPINNDWAIDPVIKISMVKDASMFYELAIPVVYKNKIWIAPFYKKTDMALAVGGSPYSNLMVNYAYEFSSKGIMGESGGTHEIALGWRMVTKKKSETPAPDAKKPYYEWILK
ncbi:MAG: type IX secretion system membrane protein PorP/SprF [Bacteroidetes bacterium]|nr:MAG: type IX secretion system membrane protein PorP/SprF [Bacteroidota bacterium]